MSKAKTTKKQVIEDSQSDSSSQLPLIVSKKEQVKAKKQTKKTPKAQESSEEEETPVVKAKNTPAPRKASKVSMDQESEKVQKKPVKAVKTENGSTKKGKKVQSSEQSSEEQAPKKVVKAKSPVQKAVVAKKKAQQSSEESSEQQPKATKKAVVPAKTTKAAVAKKVQQSSSEQSEQQVKPVKKASKSPLQKAKSPAQKPQQKKKQQSSSEQSQEQVKPKAKVAKKVTQMVQQSEEEQKPVKVQPRKASKDQVKVVAKKAVQQTEDDQEGEFEACVQGLSYQAYDSDIRALFEPCGQILHVNLLARPDGKSKGIAFVKFSRRSALNKALQMSGTDHLGRSLKIEEARGKPTASGDSMPGRGRSFGDRGGQREQRPIENTAVIQTPTLFIGGLSYNSTADSIKQFFSSTGAIQSARVVTDRQTQKPRGFGYVEFYDVQTAKKAYETLNGGYLDGRQIRLDSAAQRDRPAGGFGGNGGGFGGNRGGFGGGSRGGFGGGFGGNSRNPGNATVQLSEDDKNAKKGAIGTFQGKKISL